MVQTLNDAFFMTYHTQFLKKPDKQVLPEFHINEVAISRSQLASGRTGFQPRPVPLLTP